MSDYHYLAIREKIEKKILQTGRKLTEVELIAVTKFQSQETMKQLYQEGCRHFAESRAQEGLAKIASFVHEPDWHFIGRLQKNKVSKVAAHFDFIHSVDSLSLAQEISKAGQRLEKKIAILLQVNVSLEPSKQGLTASDWEEQLSSLNELPALKVIGLMTMAPFTSDDTKVRSCFKTLYSLREKWRPFMPQPTLFTHLSMGMSNDYLIAIEEGATLLRIGSALFRSNANG